MGKQTPSAAPAQLELLVTECEHNHAAVEAVQARGNTLAAQVGGDLGFRWHVVYLRWLISHPPNADSVRETYGELLDLHRNAPERITVLRKLGEHIRFLEDSGALPAAMVARTPRPPKPKP
ncbi:MAG: hypothetical protein KBG15_08350 [Kofleriaceae bacterium]|nr:hypothetical protein [Kofleriaceae bacterium]